MASIRRLYADPLAYRSTQPEHPRVLSGPRRAGYRVLALLAATILGISFSGGHRGASAAPGVGTPNAQPVIGLPAEGLTLIGSSPAESPGETWGYAQTSTELRVVRYLQSGNPQEGSWSVQPAPVDQKDEPLGAFTPASGAQAGRATATGAAAILGADRSGVDQLLVRNRTREGGRFVEAATPTQIKEGEPPAANAVLKRGETLFSEGGAGSLMAVVEQPNGRTGAFVVPHEGESTPPGGVLFYDGSEWRREPICVKVEAGACSEGPQPGFKVLGIDASSPQNAWLLVRASTSEGIVLFAREESAGEARWTRRALGGVLGAGFAQAKLSIENPTTHQNVSAKVAAATTGQPLTVTDAGIWIDGALTLASSKTPASFTLYYEIASREVKVGWCSVPAVIEKEHCETLESALPTGPYRSFAWSGGGPYGERVITGLPDGVTLSLHGERFERVLGDGGESGTSAGAAFSSPEEGWLAPAIGNQLTHLTTNPQPDRAQPWPVPFNSPLTAIATQPDATSGALGAQAIAVGQNGEVAHYFPGRGWTQEALLNTSTASNGHAEKPNLRGVAWPEPGRAYAVGTNGAMWLWQQATGLWEPDPARPPNLFLTNFTGVAFNPANPSQGYAVGQQGALLAYGKTWEQQKLPAALEGPEGANFTSIAFAGNEPLATYQVPNFKNGNESYSGGILAYGEDVSCPTGESPCWHADTAANALLANPVRVAGLPDGGAVIAGAGGQVIERESAGAPWQPAPAGSVDGFPIALAAIREGGALRAVVSIEVAPARELQLDLEADRALREAPPGSQAPVVTAPYPLPVSGYLLRETPGGWRDEEHGDYPTPNTGASLPHGESGVDWPVLPDAALALALPPEGGEGWAVGGQTGEINAGQDNEGQLVEAIQTAGVMRYPSSGAAPTGFSSSPESTTPGTADFAIGGGAQCATACADLAEDQLGPDEWLINALRQAGQTSVRAFLDTGPHLAPGLTEAGAGLDSFGYQREQSRYAEVLSDGAGTLPFYVAPTESDLNGEGELGTFSAALGMHAPLGTAPPGTPVPPAGVSAYAFESSGSNVDEAARVIVLDYSHSTLGAAQQCWLANQLASARLAEVPAIVIGNRAMNGRNAAGDAAQVTPILVNGTPPTGCVLEHSAGGASAYFFDSPEEDRVFTLTSGGASILAYGAGTLGYITPPPAGGERIQQFLGASGFLLAEVDAAHRSAASNRAPVNVKLIPDISQLAVDSEEGTLLRRSHTSLFKALARRPPAGMECAKQGPACEFKPDPYIPIPDPCSGPECATGLFPEYTFSSSKPDVGDFVEPDPASPEGKNVLQGPGGKPIHDAHSGLFCAYNAGTTTITVRTGGLSASVPVTVLTGSVEQPCGTTRLLNPPAPSREANLPVPLPAPAPTPTPAPSATLPPPPPPPIAPGPGPHAPAHPAPSATPVPLQAAQLFPLVPLVPLPTPAAARPTPPSGTAQVPSQSPVSQQVSVTEREEEEQSAIQHVHNMALYQPHREAPMPAWPLALILIAAAAGVGLRRRRPGTLAHAEQRSL